MQTQIAKAFCIMQFQFKTHIPKQFSLSYYNNLHALAQCSLYAIVSAMIVKQVRLEK